jgi:hypothetical protein
MQAVCSRRIRWVGHVVYVGEEKNMYEVLVGKPEGQRPLGKLRCKWDNIKMNFKETD